MKRLIRASKYSDEAAKYEKWIGEYGKILSDVVDARTPEEVQSALAPAGKWFSKISNKIDAIKAVVDQIDNVTSDYLIERNALAKYPIVEGEILHFLEEAGYYPKEINGKRPGVDSAYVIVPADEAEHQDLIDVVKAVSKHFGIKPDGQAIGGSWTSYPFKMDGVSFHIGFEPDLDYDESGKEYSLQLSF